MNKRWYFKSRKKLVTYWLDKPAHLDPSKIEIPMPQLPQPFDLPPPVIK